MAAITDLASLKANVADALVRSDLTDQIAASVPLAEAWLNRNLRLRLMESDEALTTVQGSNAVALPTGLLEPLALFFNDSPQSYPLDMRPSNGAVLTAAGRPRLYEIDGANILFDRPSDSAYSLTLRMLKRFGLTTEDSTNALLQSWPDLYLMAVLSTVCAVYLTDDPRLGVWVPARDGLLAEVLRKEARAKAPAQMRADDSLMQRRPTDRSRLGYSWC